VVDNTSYPTAAPPSVRTPAIAVFATTRRAVYVTSPCITSTRFKWAQDGGEWKSVWLGFLDALSRRGRNLLIKNMSQSFQRSD
jgi:hypothetical protein